MSTMIGTDPAWPACGLPAELQAEWWKAIATAAQDPGRAEEFTLIATEPGSVE